MSSENQWEGRLEHGGEPAELAPEHEPPTTSRGRASEWVADHDTETRDMRPALGTRGEPGPWTAADPGAPIGLARPRFGDARWSFLYRARDTAYAAAEPAPGQVAAANRRMRGAEVAEIHGPFIHAPVWSWEVPLYFWVGGMASGAAFVALACDVAGDHRSGAIARKVALGAVATAPALLIGDLGRPARFLNMMRIFKPRSPMNMGAWCLVAFSGSGALAVGCDLARRPKAARALGALTSLLGSYLGSYTGVLLACTAVPVWARSRVILGPAFVATATATGAAATRLVLVASGLPPGHPTRRALGTLETASMLTELSISAIGERRLGDTAEALRSGRPGIFFRVPRASSCSGSRCGCWHGGPAGASTTSRASCTSPAVWPSATPGYTRDRPLAQTTRRWLRWAAADVRCATNARNRARSEAKRSAARNCRCPTRRDEPMARPSGAPAWRSSVGSPGVELAASDLSCEDPRRRVGPLRRSHGVASS